MTMNRSNLLISLIILSIGVFYLTTIRDGHNWGGDFSMYIHHAKNISQGIDYKNTGYIYNPSVPSWSPKAYPPVFPLFLSPIYYLFGLNLTAMKIEIVLFFLSSLIVIFLIFKNELPFQYMVPFVVIIGFNPFFWDFKDNVLSDILFLLFVYLSLLFIHRAYESYNKQRYRLLYSLFVGLLIYLSFGTRNLGVVLIPSLIIYDLIKSRRPTKFAVIASVSSILCIGLQEIILPMDSDYSERIGLFTSDLKFILSNFDRYIESLFVLWDNGYSKNLALSVIMCGLAIIGYFIRIKENITIFELFTVFYIVPIIIWPSYQGTRFLIPLIPLYIFYAFVGINKSILFQHKGTKRFVFTILILTILVSYVGKYSKTDFGPINEGIGKKETIELFDYIKRNTDKDDIFIFLKPRVLALFTGRSASVYHWPQDKQELLKYFSKIEATHLILRQAYEPYLRLFVEEYKHNFELVYTNSEFKVYRIKSNTRRSTG